MAISHRATGTATFSAASFAPAIPAAQVTGDMMLLLVGGKPFDSSRSVGTAGWASLGSFVDGSVAAGVDTGSMFVEAWWKVATSDTETNPTVTEGATVWNVVGGIVVVFAKGASETWATPVIMGGGSGTASTSFTTGSIASVGFESGDHCSTYAAFRSDGATPTSTAIQANPADVTLTHTRDPATDPETTTGGDMGMTVTRSTVDSGSSSSNTAISCTLPAAHTGTAALIRLRLVAGQVFFGPRAEYNFAVMRGATW